MQAAEQDADQPFAVAAALAGVPVRALEQVGGGRNSRVYHVRSAGGEWALKGYPLLAADPRDRLTAEVDALNLMERAGFDNVPRVVGVDRPRGFALLTWIEGTPVTGIGIVEIDQAVAFLGKVHALRGMGAIAPERLASEACLSGQEIARQIEARLAVLRAAAHNEDELRHFLQDAFEPAWRRLEERARAMMSTAGSGFTTVLPQHNRSLVPADFGFHNSIRRPDGTLAFIDFEYFGWDDPVKLTADILFHPSVPLGRAERDRFRGAAEELYGGDTQFAQRLAAYAPLFGLRWVLIVLNEFLPQRWRLRVQAGAVDIWDDAKQRQLARARDLLRRVEAE